MIPAAPTGSRNSADTLLPVGGRRLSGGGPRFARCRGLVAPRCCTLAGGCRPQGTAQGLKLACTGAEESLETAFANGKPPAAKGGDHTMMQKLYKTKGTVAAGSMGAGPMQSVDHGAYQEGERE